MLRITYDGRGGNNMAIDLVCSMEVDEKTAKFTTEYKGTTYYFCSPLCKRAFAEDPETLLQKARSEIVDPVCKMNVDKQTAKFTSHYHGTTYYFCSVLCKRTFDEHPESFLDKTT
jgi:YHS domain-containing protein